MKKLFGHYYPLEGEHAREIWTNAVFSFDTNTLLNVYRYTEDTRKRFLYLVSKFNERIWLPHQVGLEFHENRLDVVQNQGNAHSALRNSLENGLVTLKKSLQQEFSRHNSIRVSEIIDRIDEFQKQIMDLALTYDSSFDSYFTQDPLRDVLTTLFEDRVGDPYPPERFQEIIKEGEERYRDKIPPGYKDADKGGRRKFGDLVIWNQLIDYAKKVQKPIVFITDDTKEDWYTIYGGKTIGPRPELRKEMVEKAKVEYYSYPTVRFMTYAENFLKEATNASAIAEVKSISEEDQYTEYHKEPTGNAELTLSSLQKWILAQEQYENIIQGSYSHKTEQNQNADSKTSKRRRFRPTSVQSSFKVGQKVKHALFGQGVVISCVGTGDEAQVSLCRR